MNFQEAKMNLLERASGDYCTISYNEIHFDGGKIRQECFVQLFIDKKQYSSRRSGVEASTWDEAFENLALNIEGVPEYNEAQAPE